MIYGEDGSIYHDANEAVRANAKWRQQERQNKLLKEQNDLIRQQMNSSNYSDNYSSGYTRPLTDEERRMYEDKDYNKLENLGLALLISTPLIVILYFFAKSGALNGLLHYVLRMDFIDQTSNEAGLTIFTVCLLLYIGLIIKRRKVKRICQEKAKNGWK